MVKSNLITNVKRKIQGVPHHEGEKKDKNQRVQNKQTNTQEAHRPALSSPSERGDHNAKMTENTRTKSKARLNMKQPVVTSTKPHKVRITSSPPP